jgi:hypothetical protein
MKREDKQTVRDALDFWDDRHPGITQTVEALALLDAELAKDVTEVGFGNTESAAVALLRKFRQWDMLDAVVDGPYWKREIDAVPHNQTLGSRGRVRVRLLSVCVKLCTLTLRLG